MSNRKLRRRLNHLMYKHDSIHILYLLKIFGERTIKELIHERNNSELLEIYKIGKSLNKSDNEIEADWIFINNKNHINRIKYNQMPNIEYKDNKRHINSRNSNGCSNSNRIRRPKKRRKTAWKRFYRLFPKGE